MIMRWHNDTHEYDHQSCATDHNWLPKKCELLAPNSCILDRFSIFSDMNTTIKDIEQPSQKK